VVAPDLDEVAHVMHKLVIQGLEGRCKVVVDQLEQTLALRHIKGIDSSASPRADSWRNRERVQKEGRYLNHDGARVVVSQ
jgi:hypothetical protein